MFKFGPVLRHIWLIVFALAISACVPRDIDVTYNVTSPEPGVYVYQNNEYTLDQLVQKIDADRGNKNPLVVFTIMYDRPEALTDSITDTFWAQGITELEIAGPAILNTK